MAIEQRKPLREPDPNADPVARTIDLLRARVVAADGPIEAVRELRRSERPYSTVALVELRTGSGVQRLYVKVGKVMPTLEPEAPSPAARLAREFEMLTALQTAFGPGSALRVARPVALFEAVPAIVTEEAPGKTLLAALQQRVSVWRGTRWLAWAEECCHRSGRFLQRFQAVRPRAGGSFVLEEMKCYIDRRLAVLVARRWLGVDDRWRARVLEWFDWTAAAVPPEDLRTTAVHGDYGLSNVLVDEGRVTVLDFPMVSEGSALHDVTHFHLALEQLGAHPRFTRSASRALCRAFLEGYDRRLDPASPLFTLFRLQHVACQLSRVSLRRPRSLWEAYYDRRLGQLELRSLVDAMGTVVSR